MVHILPPEHSGDILLLLLRLIIGLSFLVAALIKSKNINKFAKKNGLPVPAAILVMCLELVSSVSMILGFYTQFAAIVIMILMLGTMRQHIFKWKSPYWAQDGGWEYDLMLFTMAGVIFVFGAGSIALIS